MKPLKQFLSDARRSKGLALIIVLSMLALATIVILAFLSVADTEYKATVTFSSSQSARRYADTAVNIVISQIRSASAREPEPAPGTNTRIAVPVIHATQPGAVRKYYQNGAFMAGYKLFSDENMIFRPAGVAATASRTNERNFVASSEPPADWDEGNNLYRYVDLNDPVVKGVSNAGGNAAAIQTIFPIIDPRAGQDVDATDAADIPVEGFSYSNETALGKKKLGDKVVIPGTPQADTIDDLRLPMPVQWLYLLKDGSVGHLTQDLQFESSEGTPSTQNPIVARIAFWTDDETCKININTASEPTFMGQPIYYHERDHRWADFPPARSEYQRFPGHPATVALSSVLYPNPYQAATRSLDTYKKTAGDLSRILSVKEKIYDLMPRIHTDGSKGGTQLFGSDDFDQGAAKATAVAIQTAINERLYSSVDELLFSGSASDGKRVLNNAGYDGGSLFTKTTLERTSAFLTANSRGSEVSMFGLPKIAMWPIAEDPSRRTGFDQLIKFCSTLNPNPASTNFYIFQRAKPRDANYDISSIQRNGQLMTMLDKILKVPFPYMSKSPAGLQTYVAKFGQDNTRQLLVEMFDYIRCTNLYDSFLAPPRESWRTRGNTDWVNQYKDRDLLESQGFFKTYTPGFVKQDANEFNDRALPGHGQVTPALWRIGGSVYRGFGRSISISEIGLHFICTADGQPDMYSWRMPERDPDATQPSGSSGGPRKYRIPVVDYQNYQALEAQAWHPTDNPTGIISGGRSALKLVREKKNDFKVEHAYPIGFDGTNAQLTNLKAVLWQNDQNPDNDIEDGMMKMRYWSNYPPLDDPTLFGLYGTGSGFPPTLDNYAKSFHFHPGYHWWNWNWTLERNTPLKFNEKRVQAMLHTEFFCPAVGYPEIHPEFTMVIAGSDISTIRVNNRPIFQTTSNVVIKSGQALYHPDDHPEIGGFASFRKLSSGRLAPGRDAMPPDPNYNTDATGDIHAGITSLDLISSYFTTDRNTPLTFSSGVIKILIYDSHDYQGRDPMQTIEFKLDNGQAPPPELVVAPSYNVWQQRPADNSLYNHPTIQAPRWWTFHRGGALGRVKAETTNADPVVVDPENRNDWPEQFWNRGRLVQVADATIQATTARDITRPDSGINQEVPGANQLIYAYDEQANFRDVPPVSADDFTNDPGKRIAYGGTDSNTPLIFGTDTLRTIQPKNGDPRLIYIKPFVQASEWTNHTLWNSTTRYNGHNFSSYTAGGEPGFHIADAQGTHRVLPELVKNGTNNMNVAYTPDAPQNEDAFKIAQRYFDFDDTDPGGRVGPFINKPDEGNYAVGNYQASGWPAPKRWRATYFRTGIGARTSAAGQSFFTPNRMISSPVLMGSLPPTMFGQSGGSTSSPNDSGAWQNLLFRPHTPFLSMESSHPGAQSPPDHYLLDLFWMPVVEPYAISEALSTAGKVNMNYQIMPFTHIRRATAMHAVMKGEMFAALPNSDYEVSKGVKTGWGPNGSTAPIFRDEANEARYWHRSIVIDHFPAGAETPWWKQAAEERVQGTLRQFEERFYFGGGPTGDGTALPDDHRGGLFRSASQICEIHLIPSPVPGAADRNVSEGEVRTYTARNDKMASFWMNHCSTGDNTKERPYSNLYAKLTTRSNTFRVHVRSQTIRKATRSVAPDVFDPARDQVLAEFRGSFLLERYIDTRDTNNPLPDYGASDDPFNELPLESFYRFRVLESKRFAP